MCVNKLRPYLHVLGLRKQASVLFNDVGSGYVNKMGLIYKYLTATRVDKSHLFTDGWVNKIGPNLLIIICWRLMIDVDDHCLFAYELHRKLSISG